MGGLSTTIAVYNELDTAQKDWDALQAAAGTSDVDLADAALVVRNSAGEVVSVQRQEHHGWGKGAVAGAVVGLLFPPSIIAGAVVGGLSGGLVGRLSRALGRGNIKDLGETMDRGEIAIVVVSAVDSVQQVHLLLGRASHRMSRGDMSAAEVQTAMDATGQNPRS